MIIINNIEHHPTFNVKEITEYYSKQDGVPIQYVCSIDKIDVFYRSVPHPVHGNKYFGMYKDGGTKITDIKQEKIEELTFNALKDKDGVLHYSSHRHDRIEVGDKFIDGGVDYLRSNTDDIIKLHVVDGELEEMK